MKKLLIGLIITVFLVASAGIVMAQPGPWKSRGKKIEEIPYSNGETLLKKRTGDGGFQLWITGNRELHCVFKLVGQNDGDGWSPSSWMPGYMYKCEPHE